MLTLIFTVVYILQHFKIFMKEVQSSENKNECQETITSGNSSLFWDFPQYLYKDLSYVLYILLQFSRKLHANRLRQQNKKKQVQVSLPFPLSATPRPLEIYLNHL